MGRDLQSEVAYLSGLVEGTGDFAPDGRDGKVLAGVVRVLEQVAEDLRALRGRHEELETYVECLDEDLADLEDGLLDFEAEGAGDAEAADDDAFVEVECPECGETVYFEDAVFDEEAPLELLCPDCGSVVYEELEGEVDVVDRGGRRDPATGRTFSGTGAGDRARA